MAATLDLRSAKLCLKFSARSVNNLPQKVFGLIPQSLAGDQVVVLAYDTTAMRN